MTVDNLKKVNATKPEEFVLCSEKESVNHLFFECVVAKFMWSLASDFLKRKIGDSYESIAGMWLCQKKFGFIDKYQP
jgi:hypothetical protein